MRAWQEKKTFVSDVLGSGFVDADIKAAAIPKPLAKSAVCPTLVPAPAPKLPADRPADSKLDSAMLRLP